MFFMFIKEFHIELNSLFPWLCWLHDSCTHIILVYSWFLFSWVSYVLYRLWVSIIVWLTCLWNIYLFYSLLEGLRTSFQDYHKICCGFLHFGRVFNYTKIIFKFIFLKTPSFQGRMDGRPCLVCSNWKSF